MIHVVAENILQWGSLHSTDGSNLTPVERIHKALKAAAEFSTGVSAPFYIVNTENNEIIELKWGIY